jgi:hypothetical protein
MQDLLREEATNQCTHPVRTDNAPQVRSTATPGQGPAVGLKLVQGLGAPALLAGRRARDFSDVCIIPIRRTYEVRLSTLVNAEIFCTWEKQSAQGAEQQVTR